MAMPSPTRDHFSAGAYSERGLYCGCHCDAGDRRSPGGKHRRERHGQGGPGGRFKGLDPIWTTALITATHAWLIYDTLFAPDREYQVRPQMARVAFSRIGMSGTL